jgi:hypothetical protein
MQQLNKVPYEVPEETDDGGPLPPEEDPRLLDSNQK